MTMRWAVLAGLAATPCVVIGSAAACTADRPAAGTVLSVSEGVHIERAGVPDFRPRPLVPLCASDVLVLDEGATVRFRLGGAERVLQGPTSYSLPAPKPSNTLLDNVSAFMTEHVLKIVPESGRISQSATADAQIPGFSGGVQPSALLSAPTPAPALRWSAPGLASGRATIREGRRGLYLRWLGAQGDYRVELAGADGAILANKRTTRPELRLAPSNWSGGAFTVRVYQGVATAPVLKGGFLVGAAPAGACDLRGKRQPGAGAEELAAAQAMCVAQQDPERWGFEAFQMIDAAPREGLDRENVLADIARLGRR